MSRPSKERRGEAAILHSVIMDATVAIMQRYVNIAWVKCGEEAKQRQRVFTC